MEVPYAAMTEPPPTPDKHEHASLPHTAIPAFDAPLHSPATTTPPPATDTSASLSSAPSTPPQLPKSSSSTSLLPSDEPAPMSLTYDLLLEQAGTGSFHYQLLLLCGWANAADAIEILAASFIMISATDDLQLSDTDKGWVAAMVFLGMLIGGWLWGTLADRIGRRNCLIAALLINSLGGVLAAFVSNSGGLLVCRLIAGLGVGGSIPVIFTYFIEFLPTSQRGAYMVYLAWFWMVGAIFTAGLAWMVIPLDMANTTFLITPFHSWRLFTLLCAAPSLLCAIMLFFCPESPRFLLTMGKVSEAQTILKHMRKVNGRAAKVEGETEWCGLCCIGVKEGTRGAYDVVDMEDGEDSDARFARDLASLQTNSNTLEAPPEMSVQTVLSAVRGAASKTVEVFSQPHFASSLKLAVVWFGLSFGYYGITLWIPETFQRTKSEDNSDEGLSVYPAAFLSAACNLPGNVLSVWTVRTVGRSVTLAVSIALSALCVLLVPFVHTTWSVTLILSLFTLVSVPAWNALNLSSTELYPTAVRSSAFGVMAAVGRSGAILGNLLFGMFIGSSVVVPMAITAAMLAAAAFSAWRLRETKDVVLG